MLSHRGRAVPRWSVIGLIVALVASIGALQPSAASAAEAGSIEGTVTFTTAGFDRSDVVVTAYEWDGDDWIEVSESGLDDAGRYSVGDLAPGTYRLEFFDYSGTMATEYWDDVLDIEQAVDITVGPGEAVTDRDAVLAEAPHIVNTRAPSTSGTRAVGSTLVADPGVWAPSDVEVYYEWLVNGQDVDGAYGRTFALTPQHAGQPVAVRVTVWKPGYRPETRTAFAGAVALAAPTGLSVVVTRSGTMFRWNASPGAAGYRFTLAGRSRTYTVNTGRQTSQYFTTLVPGSTYTASVVVQSGPTTLSEPATVTFTTPSMLRVTKLRTAKRKARSSGVYWGPVQGAKRYELSYWAKGAKPKKVKTSTAGRWLKGLKPGTKYYVRVTAFSADDATRSISRKWSFTTRKK